MYNSTVNVNIKLEITPLDLDRIKFKTERACYYISVDKPD